MIHRVYIVFTLIIIVSFSVTASEICQGKEPVFENIEAEIFSNAFASLAHPGQSGNLGKCTISVSRLNFHDENNNFTGQQLSFSLGKYPLVENPGDYLFDFKNYFLGPYMLVKRKEIVSLEGQNIEVSPDQIKIETLNANGKMQSETKLKLNKENVVSIIHTSFSSFKQNEISQRFACGEDEQYVGDCNNGIYGPGCVN